MEANKIEKVWNTVMNNTRKNFDMMTEHDDDTKCVRAKVFFHY